MAIRIAWVTPVAALLLSVAGCGEREDVPREASRTDSGGASPSASAYVAQFTGEDPEACFDNDVALATADLQGPAGGPGLQVPPARVAVLIDGSGSMAGRMGGRTKLELARESAAGFVDGLASSVQTSLLAFGQQGDNSAAGKARSCSALDVLAPMSTDRSRLRDGLARVRAVGWTPLAAGLERAEGMLASSSIPGEQIIYVVSDGEETCGGDPVAAARRINEGDTRAIVNVIGFNLPASEAAALRSVAQAGGGRFVNVSTEADLQRVAEQVREANREARNAVATSNAVAGNAVRVSDAIARAEVCVSDIVSGEAVRVSNDLSARAVRGEPLPYSAEAESLLKARHDTIMARMAEYRKGLERAQTRTVDEIDSNAARAR